ncbi:SpvB/TcaC N-terminal domain-containing protein [Pseudoalteromonas xiamenensis]
MAVIISLFTSFVSIASSNSPVEFSLAWSKVEGATHYQLEERDAAGVWKSVSANPLVSTSYELSKSAGIYAFRVGGCVQEPNVKIHCGEDVAQYSNSLIVDTKKLIEKANPAGNKTPSSNAIPTLTLEMEQTASLGGAFRVDESGSATYSLPIELPQGIAGVTPEVSLNYHSQTGNGVLGMGWSLNASSSISRCRQTPVQEGSFKAIDFTLNDRFCLEGQKLILTHGQFGQLGSKYKTEINAFVELEITQSETYGPSEFKVTGKDGSIRYYGGTDNSTRKNADATASTQWLLREARDNLKNVANSISYQYKTQGENEVLLDSITYSGNTISFYYSQTRPDKSEAYNLGSLVEQTVRLESISTQNHTNEALFTYHIQYLDELVNSTKTSLIDNIKQCAGNTGSSVCLEPISFEWEKGLKGYQSSTNSTSLNANNKVIVGISPFQLKGDHKGIAYVAAEKDASKYYIYVLKNNSKTFEQVFASGALVSSVKQYKTNFDWKIIDINGDGYSEILFKTLDSSGNAIWKMYAQHGQDTPYSLSTLSMLPTGNEKLEYLDLNGDGLGDLIANSWGKKSTYYLANGYSFVSGKDLYIEQNQYTPDASSFNDIYKEIRAKNAFDVNQDGLADYIVPVFEQCKVTSAQTCEPWIDTETIGWAYYKVLIAQVDNIGTISLVPSQPLYLKPDGDYKFANNVERTDLGNNDTHVVYRDDGWSNLNLLVADLNEDGISDIVYELDISYPNSGKKIMFGKGSGFSAPMNYEDYVGKLEKLTERVSENATKFYFDLDGNGFDDQIEVRTSDNNLLVNYDLNSGATDYKANQYKITSFSDSLNNVTRVTYKPLSDRSVYTPGNTAYSLRWNNASVFDIKDGGVVVASATSSNETVNYAYHSAKIQAGGRGHLGFERIQTTFTQGSDSLVTSTTYAQNYPFIGMPLTTVKTYNGQEIGRATNTLKAINATGQAVERANYPLAFSNAPYYPYVAKSTDSNKSVNSDGTLVDVGTVTHTQTMDVWGNVLSSTTTTELNSKTATKTVTNTYGDGSNLDYKRFGRVTDTTVVHSQTGKSAITRTSKFEYNTNLMLEASIVEPNGNEERYLKTHYGYNGQGNKTSETVCSSHFASTCGEQDADLTSIGDDPKKIYRQLFTVYDNAGRYIESKSNGQFTIAQYQNFNRFGQPQTVVDENGQSTLIAYDSFGRQYHVYHPSGVATSTLSVFSTNGAAIGAPAIESHDAVIITRKTTSGQPTQWQYIDAQGQVVAEVKQGFEQSQKIYQYFTYDSKGRLRT